MSFLDGVQADIKQVEDKAKADSKKVTKVSNSVHATSTEASERYWRSSSSSYALGGYTAGGPAMVHPNEFVLNPATTRAMERQIGSPLTQANILRGASGVMATISNQFYDVGSHSIAALTGMVETATRQALKSAIKEYVGS
jgi:hypothetical protein